MEAWKRGGGESIATHNEEKEKKVIVFFELDKPPAGERTLFGAASCAAGGR